MRTNHGGLLLAVAAAITGVFCPAQQLKEVSPEEALTHLNKRVEPQYPSLAEAAKIQGEIVLQATIDENGKVKDVKALSGHPMLINPAMTAVRSWQFSPFLENGKPVAVSTSVKIGFWLAPAARPRREYLDQEARCMTLIQKNMFPDAEEPCRRALDMALKLPENFQADRMRAYGNSGTVAFSQKKFAGALADFTEQLKWAEQALPAGDPEFVQARSNIARTCYAAGKLQDADAAYTLAERAQEDAQSALEKRRELLSPQPYRIIQTSYAHNLRVILLEHAAVLRALGKVSDAAALEKKAASPVESGK